MLRSIELSGFKSFAKKTVMEFDSPISAIVGPNGSGKSNTAEAFRFALGEQSIKSLRGKKTEDLIFNGSAGVPRSNRASVRLSFNNSSRLLGLDFDDVNVERIIHRDASYEYLINQSAVRLKDILEMLARANIGPTGHHIISQGEADRILSVHPRERKLMIEDALGLKIYHYKKKESARKLSKTEENLKEIQGLERELAPRLLFLEKQMVKIEKARKLKEDLISYVQIYFASSRHIIEVKKQYLEERKKISIEKAQSLEKEHRMLKDTLSEMEVVSSYTDRIKVYEENRNEVLKKRSILERDLGRIEGEIRALERMQEPESKGEKVITLSLSLFKDILGKILNLVRSTGSVSSAQGYINEILEEYEEKEVYRDNTDAIEKLRAEAHNIQETKEALSREDQALYEEIKHARILQEDDLASVRKAEHSLLSIESALRREKGEQEIIHRDVLLLQTEEEELNSDIVELGIFLGREASQFGEVLEHKLLPEQDLRSAKKQIEKMRVKLEEANLGGAKEIEREYKEVKERAQFLSKEIHDLKMSRESLSNLIYDLDYELNKKFKDGIEKINDQFDAFFSLMFGGGSAHLEVVKFDNKDSEGNLSEDICGYEEGIEINVQLPRKRIQGLTMLSGGERSLVSTALIFAMSQIQPPPFLILDETDAALDEANSRKYGEMIENLSERSQLILITHNRETMARAGLLYGVTMGSDGVSRVLSIKFDEASAMAAR